MLNSAEHEIFSANKYENANYSVNYFNPAIILNISFNKLFLPCDHFEHQFPILILRSFWATVSINYFDPTLIFNIRSSKIF